MDRIDSLSAVFFAHFISGLVVNMAVNETNIFPEIYQISASNFVTWY